MKNMLLYLKIINNDLLESGRQSNVFFDQKGGTIGSHKRNDWSIQNLNHTIINVHARIQWLEKSYCITALAPKVFVNNTDIFTTKLPVKLQQGDNIQIADLNLQITITDDPDLIDPLAMPLNAIVSTYDDHLQEILDKKQSTRFDLDNDPITQNEIKIMDKLSADPLDLLKQEKPEGTFSLYTNNYLDDENISKKFSINTNDSTVDNTFVELPKTELNTNIISEEDNINEKHLTLTPLLRGLGAEIPLKNSKEVYEFLEEVGASLKNALEGLIALSNIYTELTDKHLRPIEDNPLQLSNDYQETINMFFANAKCPVHLSPPSAIAESLENLRLHNEANHRAISQALKALLIAFSPENLTKRFVRYRRASDISKVDNNWIWTMYKNYYEELTSNRQHGFEKLFDEVYQQTYDYEIRRLQNES